MATDLICKKVSEDTGVHSDTETREKNEPVISCRRCSSLVTRPDQQIQVNGQFTHTFANPHGQVFEIGCFSYAEGCVKASETSGDFSWFKNYVWAIALCRSCHTQLGWIFLPVRAGEKFYGLILDQLNFP